MKIASIVNPTKRSGTGKNGKPYTIMTILTDTGVEADIFAPAKEGDEVEVEQTQYGYSAKKLRPQAPNKPSGDSVLTIMKELHKINMKLDTLVGDLERRQGSKVREVFPEAEEVDLPPTENYDGIPF